jgi:hypothetical protein
MKKVWHGTLGFHEKCFDMGDYDPMRKVWLVRLGFHEKCLTWEIMIP